jgi:hypothetical protein
MPVYLNSTKEDLMQVPVNAGVEHMHPRDMSEPIRCAVNVKPTQAQKHKREMLRYFVLAIALVAVFLLISIALYYTQGKSVPIEHLSSLTPQLTLRV